MIYKSPFILPARTYPHTGSTGIGELPGSGTEMLRISPRLDLEHPLLVPTPTTKFYTALIMGHLRSLKVMTDYYYQDVNLLFENSKSELEWQVEIQASYRLSGAFPIRASPKQHLLHRGADPDLALGGLGALHETCQGGYPDCLQMLLEHEAEPNLTSNKGMALLALCTTQGSLGGHSQALPLQPCPWQEVGVNALEETALGVLCGQALGEGCLKLCQLLAAHIADVDAWDERQRSPLHKACASLVQFLLQQGADVDAINTHGLSPLMLESCAAMLEISKVIFNSYSQIPICEK
ncbi:LOW QUALITY PROTEIN: ankyrin repeat and SOCS box protein 18 [Phaethornis superciliosus]